MNHEPAFPALPISRELNGEIIYQSKGLTIRDYFAAKAMQALLARSTYGIEDDADDLAITAYEHADAMLGARK